MTDEPTQPGPRGESEATGSPPVDPRHHSRLQLVWDVTVFQFKLAADGLRDLLLSPISVIAAILGLLAGGDDPHQYFRRLLRFGRRSEAFINLFGHRRRGTSDEMVDQLRQRVFSEATDNPWLSRAGSRFNQTLDNVNARRSQKQTPSPEHQENKDESNT